MFLELKYSFPSDFTSFTSHGKVISSTKRRSWRNKKFRFSCVSCSPNPDWIDEQTVTDNENVKAIFVIWNVRNSQLTLKEMLWLDSLPVLIADFIDALMWNVFAKSLTAAFFAVLSISSFKLRRHKDTLFASDFHCFSWWMEINNSFAVRDFGTYSSFPLRKTCRVARIYISFLKWHRIQSLFCTRGFEKVSLLKNFDL